MPARSKILGELLMETEGVDADVLERALGRERRGRERVGETLVRMGAIEATGVARALSAQLGIPLAEVPLEAVDDAVGTVQADLARSLSILPLGLDNRTIRVAMADPLDLSAVDDLQFQTGRRVEPYIATASAIDEGIRRHYGEDGSEDDGSPPVDDGVAELERAIREAPVVRLVDRLLRSAINEGASDIHVEETGREVQVRVRLDGRLRREAEVPAAHRRAVLSRLKVLAGMDIAVRRRAQDGRIAFEHGGRRLTLRVSTLPVNGGEKAVVRVLDSDAAPASLGVLGMAGPDLAALRTLLRRGEGVILAAGPTGSGKSTTLFAALSELDRVRRNVVTLEDPVEYRLPGASQVQVDPRAGLGFADALRSILRQDPDVVMVGEIRDRETAEIAMAAAVTGHLVLSTIHTTDAPGAITRLLHMGVPAFLVAGGLAGVVAQRLVRRSCETCGARGCEACDRGLRGRTGVYQVLTVTDALRDEITGRASSARLRRLAADGGMGSLASDARRAVAARLTLHSEVSSLLASGGTETLPCGGCSEGVPIGAASCPHCGRGRVELCPCGERLERGWRFCPTCVRPIRRG